MLRSAAIRSPGSGGGAAAAGNAAAMLPGVQERVVRRFDRWVRGEDLAAQQRLLQQSLTVQRLIEEAHRQIGY